MAINLKRQQLYEMVWQSSMGMISRKIGVSVDNLTKACNKLSVPIPPANHWKKLKSGQPMEPLPLPPHDGPKIILVEAQRKPNRLAEWVKESQVSNQALPKHQPTQSAVTSKQPRFVPLEVWGQLLLGEHAPHKSTLLRWAREGRIQPQPVKVGHKWCVKPDAEYWAD